MKSKTLSIILIIVGLLIVIHSAGYIIGQNITPKELSLKKIRNRIESGEKLSSVEVEKIYLEKRDKGFKISTILFVTGLAIIVSVILKKVRHPSFSINSSLIEIGINSIYWLIFILLVGYVISGGGKVLTHCTIDWISLFIISGMTGFYMSYFFIGSKPSGERSWKVTIGYGLLISILGCTISYMPIGILSAIKSGNYKPLFSFQMILALGLFSFISFIHIYIGLIIRRISKQKQTVPNQVDFPAGLH